MAPTQETFQPGDILRINCILFDHVAIFVKWVDVKLQTALLAQHTGKFKFTKSSSSTSKVELQVENISGYRLLVRPKNPGQVLYRAMSKVGKGNYNLVFQNCEHFITWCLAEGEGSPQICFGWFGIAARIAAAAEKSQVSCNVLRAAALTIDSCLAIGMYVKGTISLADCGRRIAFASLITVGGAAGAAIGGKAGGIVGAFFGPVGVAVGCFVGALVGGLLGQRAARSAAQRFADWLFDRVRASALRKAYDFLGVHPNDMNKNVSNAYHEKALAAHPDKGGSNEDMKELNLCYELIKQARSDKNEPFPVGTEVMVCTDRDVYLASYQGTWVSGKIERTHGNCTYDVLVDADESVHSNVDIRYLRPR